MVDEFDIPIWNRTNKPLSIPLNVGGGVWWG
jgi:hypothetical protein